MSIFIAAHFYSITVRFISDIKYILRVFYITKKISSVFEYYSDLSFSKCINFKMGAKNALYPGLI